MQVWRRQPTQCIFCACRPSRSTTHPLRQIRELSSTAIRLEENAQKARPKKRARGRDEEYKFSVKPRWLGSEETRKAFPGARFYKEDMKDARQDDDELEFKISMAMTRLHRRLTTKKLTEDDEHTEMQELDPTEKSWKAFKAYIAGLRKKMKATAPESSDKTLWNKLHKAKGRSNSHLDTELYFHFLDFTLQPMSTNDVREAAAMSVDIRYPTEWYTTARKAQRVIHLHVGPTNSGKTYNALKRLQETKNGFYAGPLRLLAHEVYSRFRANGIPCDLITGDDIRLEDSEDTKVYASTVEMVNTSREVEVAVIDEIQMMGAEDRGWAWTRAFLGANAKEVHLCGEARVIPLIRELAASMGDTLKIHHYERLNPLRCMSRSLRGNLKQLRKGDGIVAFSIMQIHALKKQIELETGKRCAIVYGSLPPETRAEQAELFNDPNNNYDFLVASDAIGMGLNLAVKRIIFNSTTKYDGSKHVQLTIPQIKQIAGRAGRYRSAHQDKNKSTVDDREENVGLVSSLDEADLPIIRAALQMEAPPLRKAGLIPPAEYLEEYAARLPAGIPFEFLLRKVCNEATIHPRFFLCDIRDKLELARVTDDVRGLTIEQRVNITAAPATVREPRVAKCLKALAEAVAFNKFITVADVNEIPLEILSEDPRPDRGYLESLEVLHKCLILYLWLSYRFITNLRDQPMAIHAKALTEQKINWTLRAFSANPKLRERLRKLRAEQTNLDPQQFATDMPTTEGEDTPGVVEDDATMPTEAYDKKEPAVGGMQYTEELTPVHVQIGESEETMDEHFAEPISEKTGKAVIAGYFADPVEETDSEIKGLDIASQEEEDVPPQAQTQIRSGITAADLIEDLAEPQSALAVPPMSAQTQMPDIAIHEHDHERQWTSRPSDWASESIITPEESQIVGQTVAREAELRADPTNTDADVTSEKQEDELTIVKGEKVEAIYPVTGQIVQQEEMSQQRNVSATG